jgi:hypothetical protein
VEICKKAAGPHQIKAVICGGEHGVTRKYNIVLFYIFGSFNVWRKLFLLMEKKKARTASYMLSNPCFARTFTCSFRCLE